MDALFETLDVDGNGALDFEEFFKFFTEKVRAFARLQSFAIGLAVGPSSLLCLQSGEISCGSFCPLTQLLFSYRRASWCAATEGWPAARLKMNGKNGKEGRGQNVATVM